MPAGRPTKYDEKLHPKLAFRLSLLGHTDKEMAGVFEVQESTLNNWKNEHPEFLESITRGKDEADAKVAQAMYKAALGYRHKETKFFVIRDGKDSEKIDSVDTIKQYPPDMKAIAMWLSNRTKNWKNRPAETKPSGDDENTAKSRSITFTIIDPVNNNSIKLDIGGANEETV